MRRICVSKCCQLFSVIFALVGVVNFAIAQDGPSKDALAVGQAAGALMERALGLAEEPPTTPTPPADATPVPSPTPNGPQQGACKQGEYELAPGICISKHPPLNPNYPRDLEFKVCFPLGEIRICQPGFVECKTDRKTGAKTCKLRIVMPPFIPDVKCDFTESPGGGTDFVCSFPDSSSPTDKKTIPGRITYPADGGICIKVEGRPELCIKPEDLAPIPFFPELIPSLPGYPTKPAEPTPASAPASEGIVTSGKW